MMRDLLSIPAIAAVMLVAAGGIANAEQINCPRNIVGKTVDNVFVNGTCVISSSTVKGNIVVTTNGNLLVLGSTIKGSVQSEGAKRIRLQTLNGRETEVNGDVQIKNTVNTVPELISDIVGATVGGTILLDDNDATTNLMHNMVGGDVQVFQNDAIVRIRDNTIDGNLQCKENTQPLFGSGNKVGGNAEDQCAGFAN